MRRIAVVTGANAGVGRYTALGLAAHGYHVVLGCRSAERGAEAFQWIQENNSTASVEVCQLDLSDFDSVKAFAAHVGGGKVHVLVLNAGIGGLGFTPVQMEDGSDLMFRTNFVGHFLLFRLLVGALRRASGDAVDDGSGAKRKARVVCLSSVTHRSGDPSSWTAPLRYREKVRTYSTSKLAMAVLAAEISRRHAGDGICALAVNPGAVNSDIWYRSQLNDWQEAVVKPTFRMIFLTSEQGSACSMAAATDPQYEDAPPGTYLCPYRTPWRLPMPFELHGPFAGPHVCRPHGAVLDEEAGKGLWEATSAYLASGSWLDVQDSQAQAARNRTE
jgi:NAD(P)-dependent dehydrogenase (short-subunit alcohol dehydrogenase family)